MLCTAGFFFLILIWFLNRFTLCFYMALIWQSISVVIETVFILCCRIFFSVDLSTQTQQQSDRSLNWNCFSWTIPSGIDVSLFMQKVPVRFTYIHNLVELNGSAWTDLGEIFLKGISGEACSGLFSDLNILTIESFLQLAVSIETWQAKGPPGTLHHAPGFGGHSPQSTFPGRIFWIVQKVTLFSSP